MISLTCLHDLASCRQAERRTSVKSFAALGSAIQRLPSLTLALATQNTSTTTSSVLEAVPLKASTNVKLVVTTCSSRFAMSELATNPQRAIGPMGRRIRTSLSRLANGAYLASDHHFACSAINRDPTVP